MADDEPRTRAIIPSFPGTTKGGIDVWVRVVRNQARSKLCFNLISGVPATAATRAAYRAAVVLRDAAIAAGNSPKPFEDDDNAERRLSTLLWLWTSPDADWAAFMSCDDTANDVGTQMWNVVTQRYKLRTSAEVGEHRRLLQTKQRADEKIQEWWVGITSAIAYMAGAGRVITDMELCDIVTDNTITVHAAWTCLIVPGVTTRGDIERLIYSRGVHLEERLAASQQEKTPGPTAFPATPGTMDDLMKSVNERFTALSAAMQTDHRQARGGRGRGGRGRGRSNDSSDPRPETRTCYGCGRVGHIRPNCPDREQEDSAGPAVAFPAFTFTKKNHHDDLLAAGPSHSPDPPVSWVVDSGASRHCSAELSDFDQISYPSGMGIISGINCEIKGLGSVSLLVLDKSGRTITMLLKNVLYVPDLSARSNGVYLRLMSVRLATVAGYKCSFASNEDLIEHPNGVAIKLVRHRGLIWLPNPPLAATVLVAQSSISRDLIHRRTGHLHEDSILKMDKLEIDGIWGYARLPPLSFCPDCAVGKSRVSNINRTSTRGIVPPAPFHTVALDIWGPMSTPDIEGNKWFLGAVCYKTSTVFGNLMKNKSDATDVWGAMIQSVKTKAYTICRVRIDNDSVFLCKEFTDLCSTETIAVERTVPYSHWQLGRIERQWRTIADGAKTLLLVASLPNRFWGNAFLTMVYIRNRCWSSGANGIPFHLTTGKLPDLSNLRVFGCEAFVHIDVSRRRKMGDKAWKGIFVGYAFDSPSWLIYNPITRRIIRSRNVVFNEAWRTARLSLSDIEEVNDDPSPVSGEEMEEAASPPAQEGPRENHAQELPIQPPSRTEQLELERIVRVTEQPRSRSEWAAQALAQAAVAALLNSEETPEDNVVLTAIGEPTSYTRAMRSEEKEQWRTAVQSEYDSLLSNSTWDSIPYEPGMTVIGSAWKFKLKRDSEGNISKYKARLVARGDMQEPDWNSVFAPTVRYTSLRVLLALACHEDLEIEQMDVITAFLNADVESNVYMEQPEGFKTTSAQGGRMVCHLRKALYGIREAPKA
jgi:hypothetical protein